MGVGNDPMGNVGSFQGGAPQAQMQQPPMVGGPQTAQYYQPQMNPYGNMPMPYYQSQGFPQQLGPQPQPSPMQNMGKGGQGGRPLNTQGPLINPVLNGPPLNTGGPPINPRLNG